tara:strand:- start:338 stop:1069 length:732 start_codon:yes stop_codon:yes gene_type:complete
MKPLDCLREGAVLIWQPGFRGYVLVPLIINILVFTVLIGGSIGLASGWIDAAVAWLPDWLAWLAAVIWLLFALLFMVIVFYVFTMIANIIAAPFNALLAVKVEEHLGHRPEGVEPSLLALVPRTLSREFAKIAYFLPRMLGLVVFSFIPVVQIAVMPLWLLFGAWMMAVQYTDFAAENNVVSFSGLRERLGEARRDSLVLGGAVYLAMLVPFVNLIVVPSAVAGGTVFFVRRLTRNNVDVPVV